MPFIDMGSEFKDAKETPIAPEREYDLVAKVLAHDTENGKNNLVLQIRIEGEDYMPFRHWMALPNPKRDKANDETKGHEPGTTAKMKMLMCKRFCYLFDVPFDDNGFNSDDIEGARCRGYVTQDTVTRDDGTTYVVNKLSLPRLPDEDSQAA